MTLKQLFFYDDLPGYSAASWWQRVRWRASAIAYALRRWQIWILLLAWFAAALAATRVGPSALGWIVPIGGAAVYGFALPYFVRRRLNQLCG